MLLEQHINKHCPRVSHTHNKGHKNIKQINCYLCNQSLIPNFKWECNLYFKIENVNIQEEFIIRRILTYSTLFYLPVELQDIIINYCVYRNYIPIKLEKYSIDHMCRCYECSPKFLKWIDVNTCNKHMLPRSTPFNI